MSDEPTHNVREFADKIRVETKVKRGTGTRDQDEIKVKVRGDDPDAVVERLNDAVSNIKGLLTKPAVSNPQGKTMIEQTTEPKPTTVYRVSDERGVVERVRDPERAGRLSRAGLRVTAVTYTVGQR